MHRCGVSSARIIFSLGERYEIFERKKDYPFFIRPICFHLFFFFFYQRESGSKEDISLRGKFRVSKKMLER